MYMKVKETEKEYRIKMTVDRKSTYYRDVESWGAALEDLLKDDSQFKGIRCYINMWDEWRPMCKMKGKKE